MNTGDVRFPVHPVAPSKKQAAARPKQAQPVSPFANVWHEALQKQEGVKFSAHALQRLQERKIQLGADEMDKIQNAVAAADKKGSRSSLLLYDDLALVASIKNRTIITAMGGEDMQAHVFTNIDSAVIIK